METSTLGSRSTRQPSPMGGSEGDLEEDGPEPDHPPPAVTMAIDTTCPPPSMLMSITALR